MSTRLTLATGSRVLAQLRNDHRSVALMLVAPLVLLTLLRYVYDDAPQQAWPLAERQIVAHLERLQRAGRLS